MGFLTPPAKISESERNTPEAGSGRTVEAGRITWPEAKQIRTTRHPEASYPAARVDLLPTQNKNPTDQALPCNPAGVFIEPQYMKHQRGHHDSRELTVAPEPGSGAESPGSGRPLWGATLQGEAVLSHSSETRLLSNKIKPLRS